MDKQVVDIYTMEYYSTIKKCAFELVLMRWMKLEPIIQSEVSTGEGIGYPLQYSWSSLVVQLVKNPPAKRETQVSSLGWEDPLEKGKTTHSSILTWRTPRTI